MIGLTTFSKYVETRCKYETIYDDSEGRCIVVVRMLDLYALVNEFMQHQEIETKRKILIVGNDAA